MFCKKCGAEMSGNVCEYCGCDSDLFQLAQCAYCGNKTYKSICECCGTPIDRAVQNTETAVSVPPNTSILQAEILSSEKPRIEVSKETLWSSVIADIAQDGDKLYQLAMVHLSGISGRVPDYGLIEFILNKSGELGDNRARYKLGEIYERGADNISKDERKAKFWYELAADAGYEPARVVLSVRLKDVPSESKYMPNYDYNTGKGLGQSAYSGEFLESGRSREAVYKAMRCTLEIMTPTSNGTGFLLKNGLVVTNMHVIGDKGNLPFQILGKSGAGTDYRLVCVYTDPVQDVAILRVAGIPPLEYLSIGSTSVLHIADSVFTIGNPMGYGLSYSEGSVAQTNVNYFKIKDALKTNMSLYFGNSGGPLCNASGEVVGMMTFVGDNDGAIVPEASYAVPAETIISVINHYNK